MTTVLLHNDAALQHRNWSTPPRPQVRVVRGGNHGLNRARHVCAR